MRGKVIFVLLLAAWSFSWANPHPPIQAFCIKNGIQKKSVLIALSLSDCAVCYLPPDELLDRIRNVNKDIPVYVVSDEEMAAGEKAMFKSKFGIHANSLTFTADKTTYQYMLSEKKGLPSVCCVSANGEVLVFKHLKHESLTALFDTLRPAFELYLVKKTDLKSDLVSPKKHHGAFYLNNSIYLFHAGANVIAKYNLRGENVKNLLIDSVPADYLQLARQIFPEKIYTSSEAAFRQNRLKRNRLIRPIHLIDAGNDTLCVLMEVIGCGDTVLNNKPTQYNRGYSCMFLFDTEFHYLGAKFYSSKADAGIVNIYMRGAYLNRRFYLGRYDAETDQNLIAEYELENSSLILKHQFAPPKQPEEKGIIPIVPVISRSGDKLFVSYFKANAQGVITSVKTFRIAPDQRSCKEVLSTDGFWAQLYATKKDNYVLFTIDSAGTGRVKGYNKSTGRFMDCQAAGGAVPPSQALYFVFDGQLQEYAYAE